MQAVHKAKAAPARQAMQVRNIASPEDKAILLVQEIARGKQPLSALYANDPMTRVAIARLGVPSYILHKFSVEMELPKERVYTALGLPRQTAMRKVKEKAPLDVDSSERALCMAGIIGRIEQMTKDSAPAGFSPGQWVARWLDSTHPALGGVTPASLLDTAEGRKIVASLVDQIQAGAYA